METKQLVITPPSGYEVDVEQSSFNCIKFKPIKQDYDSLVLDLYTGGYYAMFHSGRIDHVHNSSPKHISWTDFKTKKQAEKVLAVCKLLNVVKWLNKDWTPDWDNAQELKYHFRVRQNSVYIDCCSTFHISFVYFKTRDLAQQAIDILGEDTIKLALSTDW